MAEKALAAVVQEACVQGVSTRSVDDLDQAIGMSGISKSQVSRLCGEIDGKVQTFLDRPLEGDWPYLWRDATYVKVREAGRDGAAQVVNKRTRRRFPVIEVIYADAGYQGPRVAGIAERSGIWRVEIVKRLAAVKGFVVQPKRWIVERTLAALSKRRR